LEEHATTRLTTKSAQREAFAFMRAL
jgi:hypothetical protein